MACGAEPPTGERECATTVPQHEYRRALVSFIDILGFRNLVASATVDEILDVLRSKIELTLHWEGDTINRIKYKEGKAPEDDFYGTTISFSDLIVNVTPVRPIYPLFPIFQDLVTLGFRQMMLAMRGVFVRGGITLGDIYVDESVIFGPALIQAYDLERLAAKWPIIAFDPQLIRTMKGMARRHVADRRRNDGVDTWLSRAFLAEFAMCIKKTDDGVYFLDYLSCFAYEDSTTGDLRYYLQDHRDVVKKAHARHRHWKYSFIAEYHDTFSRRHFPDQPAFLIGPLA
jgi:hypothetical protein